MRETRQFVAEALLAGGYQGDVDVVLLLASEVATNAVVHARTAFEVAVDVTAAAVRVEVTDGAGALVPKPRLPTLDATSGRGLLILDLLATRWGTDRTEDGGKTVWFEAV